MKLNTLDPDQYALIVESIVYNELYQRFKYCGQPLTSNALILIEKFAFNNERINSLIDRYLPKYNLSCETQQEREDLAFSVRESFNYFLVNIELTKTKDRNKALLAV